MRASAGSRATARLVEADITGEGSDVHKTLATIGVAVAGVALTISGGPAALADDTDVIHVPSDFAPEASDTRATGHYAVQGTGLRVWTEGAGSTDKVAEYVATSTPLADVGEPSLLLTHNSGSIAPGFQLVVDFDGNGSPDGILVGEPAAYGNDWWLNNAAAQFVKDGAPSHSGGYGSANHGTLDQWRSAFPDANVVAFGFALGSGVLGDWVIDAIDFAGTHYTFAADVLLSGKDDCKRGGWATSTQPVFKNQGDCVSYFATSK